ncbi:XdhC family protein [Mucilaginibacter pineti]|uniref:XdhC family protein n=1 Tax=Mucilaginibacter pineti TaxID=1391627 RepID=UPI000B84E2FF|nr:XdhC family protein [Mucilaginibacter pineti]
MFDVLTKIFLIFLALKKSALRLFNQCFRCSTITEKSLEAIHGPVGLDIGSETAEEIALSIVAEIKAVFSERNGHPLKYKTTVIHSV